MQSAKKIVSGLDSYIIGQSAAKRSVATAVINRRRRAALAKELQKDVMPKNILLVGPSGVGKTEIARRLAQLVDAPFVKVEATKFTEVGYVGQDVEKIIKDLVESAVRAEQERLEAEHKAAAEERTLLALLTLLKDLEKPRKFKDLNDLKKKILSGDLDKVEVEVDIPSISAAVEIIVPPGLEEMTQQIEQLFKSFGSDKSQKKSVAVPQAYKLMVSAELDKFLDANDVVEQALARVENYGIVFLDEIDKLIAQSAAANSDISRGGVQRDLLPLLEGTVVSTKYGPVATDHILFIASGAFINVKPTDLASELQGRLPVVVHLSELSIADLRKILVEPKNSLVNQYTWLLSVDAIELEFAKAALDIIANTAFELNRTVVNLGARRLSMVLEAVLEDYLYEPREKGKLLIDEKIVTAKVKDLIKDRDDARWVL